MRPSLIQVSAKVSEAARVLKKAGIPSDESEACVKLKSRLSRAGRIREPDTLPAVLALLSHEKSRALRVLNDSLQIPRRLLTSRDLPELSVISRRNFKAGECDSITSSDRLLARRNGLLDEGIIARLRCKRKSTQSSCEEDSCEERPRERMEDHRQSADLFDGVTLGERGDVHRTPASESCRSSSSQLQSHREYYQSIESACPIHLDKPASYSDRRACDRTTACASHVRPPSEADERNDRCGRGERVTSRRWTSGKPATESEIHRKCKSRPCAPAETRRHDLEQSDTALAAECRVPRTYPPPYADTYELQTRPDPPPPSCQHWTENPPSYCDRCSARKRTCVATVEPSPMIFVPVKGPRKFRGAAQPLEDVCGDSGRKKGNEPGRMDAETMKVVDAMPRLRRNSPGKSIAGHANPSEDKRVDSSCASASATPAKHRWFLAFARSDRCGIEKPEKKFATWEVSGHSKSDATSLKYRSGEYPCVKKMRNMTAREPPAVEADAWRRRRTPARRRKRVKRLEFRRETAREGKEKRVSGWTRQRYKMRLKIFRKPDGQLDPCLPPIAELRQPRATQTYLTKSEFESTAKIRAASSRLQSPCTAQRPVVETKSYPTKMEESRVDRGESLGKCSRRK